MRLFNILEQIVNEVEDKAQDDALSAAMGASFNALGREFKSNESEIKQDVENADIELTEAITAITVIGFLLAAPKVIELFVKGLGALINLFKKTFRQKGAQTPEEQSQIAARIINFTHKWHKMYIKGVKWILNISGLFAKAGIKGEANQNKAAELVYYSIIAALAVYSGVGAFSAFKQAAANGANIANMSLGTLETAMASVKTAEVASFMSELGLKSA
jgi:hypothetical protein